MENVTNNKLKNSQTAVGIRIVESKSLGFLKIIKQSGMDWVFIDCEHGSYDINTVYDLCRYSNAIGLCPVVKVPKLDSVLISRPLDQMAMGIIVPMIETAEQAEDAVKFTRFPPTGQRGCGLDGNYVSWEKGAAEYLEWSNENVLLILQIESKKAIQNIDEIAKTKGVDVLLVGPLDLSISLGVPGDTTNPLVVDAIEKIADACDKSGVAFGFPGSVDSAAKWYKKGARLFCLGSDTTFFADGCKETMKQFNKNI